MWRLTFFSTVVVVFVVARAEAVPMRLTYAFDGTVTNAGGNPFGITAGPMSGQFDFITESPATNTAPLNGLGFSSSNFGYRQQLADGFSLNFGGTSIVASDYFITISDNVEVGPFGTFDVFRVAFYPQAFPAPPPSLPLTVDGTPQNDGFIELSLFAPATLYNSPPNELPTSLVASDYNQTGFVHSLLGGIFGSRIDSTASLTGESLFTPTSSTLTQTNAVPVPEPRSIALGVIGVLGLLAMAASQKIRRFAFLPRSD